MKTKTILATLGLALALSAVGGCGKSQQETSCLSPDSLSHSAQSTAARGTLNQT